MRYVKAIFFIFFCGVTLFSSAQTVRVAAASDLKFVMPLIVESYKKLYPNADIMVTSGSSGQFYQQICNGAPYDLFFSADVAYPKRLKEQNLVDGDIHIYGYGLLVLWSSAVDLSSGVMVLKHDEVKHIALANKEHAPYGSRAVEVLNYYGLKALVKSKLVEGDNVMAAAQFAFTGNADLAFIAKSIALSTEFMEKGHFVEIDASSYSPLDQSVVLILQRVKNEEAKRFMQYVLSDACKPLLLKYGFKLP